MSRKQGQTLSPWAEKDIRIQYNKAGLSQREADQMIRELQGGQHNTKALSINQIVMIAVNGRRKRDEMEAQAARLDELRKLDAEMSGAMSAGNLTNGELKEIDARIQENRKE